MIYATTDNDCARISDNAAICAFKTEAEARAYLLSGYDAADWDHAAAVIEPGHFGDAWYKFYSWRPGDEERFAPFTAEQLYIQRPGQHPGGRAWWITPRPEVLVISAIAERAAD